MKESLHILIAGETWITHFSNIKGRNEYSGAEYYENPGVHTLSRVLQERGINVTHISNHKAVYDFPFHLDELMNYDCIVLSDIGSDTLLLHPDTVNLRNPMRTPDRLKLIRDYVNRGGGLLMIGGWMSFSGIDGRARYHMTSLADVLPVTMLPFDDRVERCDGFCPTVNEPDHPILNGVGREWPYFLGYQRVIPKPNSKVLMNVDEDPFLVVSSYGKGRAAAFASDCGPHWGSTEFLNWIDYGKFWSQLILWLGSE